MSILFLLGLLVALAGGVWFLVVAFKEHILWGLGSLLVPFVSLVFLIMHFGKSWRPFVVQVLGILIMIPGMIGMAAQAEQVRGQQMVPITLDQPLSDEQTVDVLMKLKDNGIKATITLGKIYVPAKEVDRAVALIEAPEAAK